VIRTKDYLYKRNYLGRKLCNPMADAIWDPDIPRNAGHAEFYDLRLDPDAQQNRIKDPEYRESLNSARQTMNVIMAQVKQEVPHLILEQCQLRPLHERIRWPIPSVDE
jgi:hypothetical protein